MKKAILTFLMLAAFYYLYSNQTLKDMSNIQEEIWKDVIGYEGHYQVSNIGNVRSLDRKVKNFKGEFNTLRKGRSMPLHVHHKGYFKVALTKEHIFKQKFVHRLVAIAFIPNPEGKPCINHRDGNRQNNVLSNLEWCTNYENIRHSWYHLDRISKIPRGEAHHSNKAVNQYDLKGNLIASFYSCAYAESVTGFRQLSIARVARGERKKYRDFKWSYV